MVSFLDGPAAGVTLMLRRAPIYLRVTFNPAGKVDALDQLDDEPKPDEIVHVYRKVPGTSGKVHVRPGGCYEMGDYRHVADAVGDELRDTAAWRSWVARVADPRLPLLAEDTPAPQGSPTAGERSPVGG